MKEEYNVYRNIYIFTWKEDNFIIWNNFSFCFKSWPKGIFFIAFRERGREKERERHDVRETLIGCLLVSALTRYWPCNPGTHPDRWLNLRPFSLWDNTPTNWATLARAKYNNFPMCMWQLSFRNWTCVSILSYLDYFSFRNFINLNKFLMFYWWLLSAQFVMSWGENGDFTNALEHCFKMPLKSIPYSQHQKMYSWYT